MRLLPTRGENADPNSVFWSPFHNNREAFCGHKIDVQRPPKTNCTQCWAFFFLTNQEFTTSLASRFVKDGGEQSIINEHGAKFMSKLKWFFEATLKAQEVDKIMKERELEETLANTDHDIMISDILVSADDVNVAIKEDAALGTV
jgi:hypothetical protein